MKHLQTTLSMNSILSFKPRALVLATIMLLAPALSSAQSFQLKQFSPGLKSSAGVLSNQTLKPSLSFLSDVSPNYGEVELGVDPSRVFTLKVQNGAVVVSSVGLAGGFYNVGSFGIRAETCAERTLNDGDTCQIEVGVNTANQSPSEIINSLIVLGSTADNADIRNIASVTLRAKVLFGRPDFNETSLDFGPVNFGSQSPVSVAQFNNNGTGNLIVDGFTPPAGFLVEGFQCTTESGAQSTLPVVLRPFASGDKCAVSVRFAPTASVAYSAPLQVISNGYNSESLTLTGTGTTPIVYATWNEQSYRRGGGFTLSADKLTMTNTAMHGDPATVAANKSRSTGKHYFEIRKSGHRGDRDFIAAGLYPASSTSYEASQGGLYVQANSMSGSNIPGYSVIKAPAAGSISVNGHIGVAVDLDLGRIDFYNATNCTLISSASFTPGAAYKPVAGWTYSNSVPSSIQANFGQYAMNCPVPQGYQKGWF